MLSLDVGREFHLVSPILYDELKDDENHCLRHQAESLLDLDSRFRFRSNCRVALV